MEIRGAGEGVGEEVEMMGGDGWDKGKGTKGVDTLDGGDGPDTWNGGAGEDVLRLTGLETGKGGAGNDTFQIDEMGNAVPLLRIST